MDSLASAIQALHDTYRIPHIVITSVKFPAPGQPSPQLSVVGSSMSSDGRARLFKIVFPAIDCYFSGTGDMFAALMVVRMREAVTAVPGLGARASWLSGDDTATLDLPLARAAEKVLASMHEVLSRTSEAMKDIVEQTIDGQVGKLDGSEKMGHLVQTKAAELQLVRHPECLRSPTVEFKAKVM